MQITDETICVVETNYLHIYDFFQDRDSALTKCYELNDKKVAEDFTQPYRVMKFSEYSAKQT